MQISKILWFTIAASTVIYLVVAYTIVPVPVQPFVESVLSIVTLGLYAAAFAAFVAALVIPNLLTRTRGMRKMIVALALFEFCALCGFIAAFLGQDWRLYLPAWIVSLIGFVREFPRDRA